MSHKHDATSMAAEHGHAKLSRRHEQASKDTTAFLAGEQLEESYNTDSMQSAMAQRTKRGTHTRVTADKWQHARHSREGWTPRT